MVSKKFIEFEDATRTCLPKVESKLIIELLQTLNEEEYSGYTLQVFLKDGSNTDVFRETIIKDLGVVPAFHKDEEYGEHTAIEHRVRLETLRYLNNFDEVIEIGGSRAGGGRASIGPRLERDTEDKLSNTTKIIFIRIIIQILFDNITIYQKLNYDKRRLIFKDCLLGIISFHFIS